MENSLWGAGVRGKTRSAAGEGQGAWSGGCFKSRADRPPLDRAHWCLSVWSKGWSGKQSRGGRSSKIVVFIPQKLNSSCSRKTWEHQANECPPPTWSGGFQATPRPRGPLSGWPAWDLDTHHLPFPTQGSRRREVYSNQVQLKNWLRGTREKAPRTKDVCR